MCVVKFFLKFLTICCVLIFFQACTKSKSSNRLRSEQASGVVKWVEGLQNYFYRFHDLQFVFGKGAVGDFEYISWEWQFPIPSIKIWPSENIMTFPLISKIVSGSQQFLINPNSKYSTVYSENENVNTVQIKDILLQEGYDITTSRLMAASESWTLRFDESQAKNSFLIEIKTRFTRNFNIDKLAHTLVTSNLNQWWSYHGGITNYSGALAYPLWESVKLNNSEVISINTATDLTTSSGSPITSVEWSRSASSSNIKSLKIELLESDCSASEKILVNPDKGFTEINCFDTSTAVVKEQTKKITLKVTIVANNNLSEIPVVVNDTVLSGLLKSAESTIRNSFVWIEPWRPTEISPAAHAAGVSRYQAGGSAEDVNILAMMSWPIWSTTSSNHLGFEYDMVRHFEELDTNSGGPNQGDIPISVEQNLSTRWSNEAFYNITGDRGGCISMGSWTVDALYLFSLAKNDTAMVSQYIDNIVNWLDQSIIAHDLDLNGIPEGAEVQSGERDSFNLGAGSEVLLSATRLVEVFSRAEEMLRLVGQTVKADEYLAKKNKIIETLNKDVSDGGFWQEDHYVTFRLASVAHDYKDFNGNIEAALLGIANQEKSAAIFSWMEQVRQSQEHTLIGRQFGDSSIMALQRPGGWNHSAGDYQLGSWPHVAFNEVFAHIKLGQHEKANELLKGYYESNNLDTVDLPEFIDYFHKKSGGAYPFGWAAGNFIRLLTWGYMGIHPEWAKLTVFPKSIRSESLNISLSRYRYKGIDYKISVTHEKKGTFDRSTNELVVPNTVSFNWNPDLNQIVLSCENASRLTVSYSVSGAVNSQVVENCLLNPITVTLAPSEKITFIVR